MKHQPLVVIRVVEAARKLIDRSQIWSVEPGDLSDLKDAMAALDRKNKRKR